MADPDGKEMFLQLLSALKDDVAEKTSTSSRRSLGQDRGFIAPGMGGNVQSRESLSLSFKSFLVLPVIFV